MRRPVPHPTHRRRARRPHRLWLSCALALGLAAAGAAPVARAATDWGETTSIQIDRQPAEVFRYVAEPEKQRQWVEGLEPAAPLTGGELKVGSRALEALLLDGQRYEVESEVLALEPGRSVEIRYTNAGLELTTRYEVQEAHGGTQVTVKSRSTFKTWKTALLGPLITRTIRNKSAADLESLKKLLERDKSRTAEQPHGPGSQAERASATGARAASPSSAGVQG